MSKTANNYKNIAKAKAIEKVNRERLLKLNPMLNDESGIYFWTRTDELGVKHAYVGQALHILTRNTQHMTGFQYIDLSIKAHKLYDAEKNPTGYKLNFINCPESELDEEERYYITLYARQGYQMKNRDTGGGSGKQELGERRQPKTYRQGVQFGKLSLARAINELLEKYFTITLKADVAENKRSEKAREKLDELLNEENYKE